MPVPATLLPFVVKAIPIIIGAWKQLKERNPDVTDEEIIMLLQSDAQRIIDRGEAWLAEHPED